jgi:hypothetical protein
MPLQIRRGNTAEVSSIIPSVGELIYDTQLKRILIGDGSTAGGTPVAGVSISESKDSAAQVLLDGTHQNINFSYNSTTKALSASVLIPDIEEFDSITIGKIFAAGSNLVLDVEEGMLISDVTGDITGNLTGDVTGDVTGNTFGVHEGNIVTNNITSIDSSQILVTSIMRFESDVVANELTVSKLTIDTELLNENLVSLGQFHNSSDSGNSAAVSLRRSRGTLQSPETVQAGDQLFKINFSGFGETDYNTSISIRGMVDPAGTVSPFAIPGKLEIYITDNDGIPKLRADLDRSGVFTNYGQHWVRNNIENSLIQNLTSHYNNPGLGSRLSLRRSRGTYDSPTAVSNGDSLFRIAFGGYDGTNYREGTFISSSVSGAVSTGIVPTNLKISTTNAAGVTSSALEINENQDVKINKSISLATYVDSTERDSAISTPQGGMLVYITGTNKFQGFVTGTGWVNLN